jgi:serine protease
VSGIAALLVAAGGASTPAALRAALLETADDRGAPGRDDRFGAGMVDPAAAIRAFAGLPFPAAPALVLDTDALGFGGAPDLLGVHARNAGGGTLAIGSPEAATDDGLGWLTAAFTAATSTVEVRVARRHLLAGEYTGRVHVPSNGGTGTLAVHLAVEPRPPVDVGPVTIELLDPATRERRATAVTTFASGYAYRVEGVRGGPYELRAGTDDDHDGVICEVGELCGAYPVLPVPVPVTVVGGQVLEGRDFVVAPSNNQP